MSVPELSEGAFRVLLNFAQVQKKHAKKFSIKNFGPPKTPKFFM